MPHPWRSRVSRTLLEWRPASSQTRVSDLPRVVRRLQIAWFILVLARKVTAMSRSSRFLPFGLTALSAFAVSLAPTEAQAATEIAGDFDIAAPIDSSFKTGGGFGFRLGNHLHLPMVVVTPELAFTYHDFSGGYSAATYRGVARGAPRIWRDS